MMYWFFLKSWTGLSSLNPDHYNYDYKLIQQTAIMQGERLQTVKIYSGTELMEEKERGL